MIRYKDLEADYKKLLEDAIKKLSLSVERDSKVLTEMNNSLNWIVTLTGVILATGISYFKDAQSCETVTISLYLSRTAFCVTVLLLIIHKICLLRYETLKFQFLSTLNTHELELKYDLKLLKNKLDENAFFSAPEFINDFRNGKFVPLEKDERKPAFAKMDKAIARHAVVLKCTFWLSMVFFSLNFLIVFYLILS